MGVLLTHVRRDLIDTAILPLAAGTIGAEVDILPGQSYEVSLAGCTFWGGGINLDQESDTK